MRTRRPCSSHLLAPLVRVLIGILILAGVTAVPRAALAAGTVQVANLSPKEDENGRWKLKMTINYGSIPHVTYVPMIFSFTPTVLYERSLTDQSPQKPVITRLPLTNQQDINESMDVGFMDAGTGKVYTTTKFDFVIRRDRGFEAGEYKLVIKRAGDGVTVGRPMTLRLQGDNPIVDRRAIVFAGEGKRKGKTEKKEESTEQKAATEGAEEKDEASDESGEEEDTSSEETSGADDTPTEAPPPEPPKQGGCGCRIAGADAGSALYGPPAWGLSAIALLGLARLRRRGTARHA